jgi:hypothetical protein
MESLEIEKRAAMTKYDPEWHTTVPAQPGWSVLVLVGKEFEKHHIVAWDVSIRNEYGKVWHAAIPITVEASLEGGVLNLNNQWCIERPDGKIIFDDTTNGIRRGIVDDEAQAMILLQLNITVRKHEERAVRGRDEVAY